MLAIAIGGDWCGIRIESGYHRGWPLPNKHYIYPQHRPLAATAEDGAARELISHSGTAGQQPREPVGATRNKPAVGPDRHGPGTIGDKLRLKASCQGNFRWWLQEKWRACADALPKASDNQLNLGFSLSFNNP